jgi:hypothetical protein
MMFYSNNKPFSSEFALRLEQAPDGEVSDHVAQVIYALSARPDIAQLSLMMAYATADDPLVISYLASIAYGRNLNIEQSVIIVVEALHAIIADDFGEVAAFEMLVEPLFDPADELFERMAAVRRFAKKGYQFDDAIVPEERAA